MIEEQPLISIVIPVYKVEPYIRQCVESVLSQDFDDYELILVDDGSPDGCPKICDEYALTNKNVKVIHKENGGLSDARNYGIKSAVGKYLLFIDSDDYIATGSLREIAKTINLHTGLKDEADVVFLTAKFVFPESKITDVDLHLDNEIICSNNRSEILKHLSVIPQLHVSACLKAVRRDLIVNNTLFFTKGLLCEDVDWSIKLYLHSKCFIYCKHDHYFYRQNREGSIMIDYSEKRFSDILDIIVKWVALASEEYLEYADIIYYFLYHQYYSLVLMYNKNKNIGKYKKKMKELSRLLNITKSKKSHFVKAFYKIFGFRLLSIALNIIMAEGD